MSHCAADVAGDLNGLLCSKLIVYEATYQLNHQPAAFSFQDGESPVCGCDS